MQSPMLGESQTNKGLLGSSNLTTSSLKPKDRSSSRYDDSAENNDYDGASQLNSITKGLLEQKQLQN